MTSLLPNYNPEQADFRAFTDVMTLNFNPLFEKKLEPSESLVFMTGSSTIKDLQGDSMSVSALQDMTHAPANLSVWMNHEYELPGKLFGSLAIPPIMVQHNGIADLCLAVDTELENPDAKQTYLYIKKGRRLGCSGGFKVLEWSVDGDPDDWVAPLIIHHVYPVEWSVVGIPANQRSWVECAASGIFLRSLADGRDQDALRLAPIVKSLFPRDYKATLELLPNEALRKDLERIAERPAHPSKLLWQPLKKTFLFTHKKESHELEPEMVGFLLGNGAPGLHQTLETFLQKLVTTDQSLTAQEEKQEEEMPPTRERDELLVNADGTHGISSRTHTHVHAPYQSQGDDKMHEHEHSHQNDNQHDHEHPEKMKAAMIVDEQGKEQQEVPSLSEQVKGVDPLAAMRESFFKMGEALGYEMSLLLEGKKGISKAHLVHAQAIHDHIFHMTEGSVCGKRYSQGNSDEMPAEENSDLLEEARRRAQQERETQMHWRKSLSALTEVLKSFEGIDVKALRDEIIIIQAATQTTQEDLKKARLQASSLQDQFHQLEKSIQSTETHIEALRSLPLGRPTTLQRQIADPLGSANYDQMRHAGTTSSTPQMTLQEALAQTKIIQLPARSGVVSAYREWPEGLVPEGGRPVLTPDQRSLMNPYEVIAYEEKRYARVPLVDDPTSLQAKREEE